MKKFLLTLLGFLLINATAYSQDEIDEVDASEMSEETDREANDTQKASINPYRLGNGIRLIAGNGNNLVLSGLVQTTASTKKYGDIDKHYNRFRVRRARVRLDGTALGSKIRYRVGLDLVKGSETDDDGAGSLLQDAWIGYRPWGDNRMQISFGQRSTPTDNIELSMSSHTLSFVERSRITSVFATIREIGFFVESSLRLGHTQGILRPSIAITDGDGPISGGKRYGGLKYGARINYLPFGTFRNYGQTRESDMVYEFTPKLNIGVAYSYNQGVSDRRGGRASGDILYMDAKDHYKLPDMGKLVADINFKYAGFSFIAEFAKTWGYVSDKITQRVRTAGTTTTDFAFERTIIDAAGNQTTQTVQDKESYIKNRMLLGWGLNIQMGYMFRSLWSIDARYTHIQADDVSFLNNDLYFNRPDYVDLGISKYLTHSYASKLQLTVGWGNPDGQCRTPDSRYYSGNEWNVDLMFQLKF
ncbi:porin [Prevotella sp. KH2C16]|uniref:porin n=1 Tax=Prevotella sp. KH2C16 TaxID=1855325 RepID=UPI0008F37496|nr:porin [Prevotella sp. KH2C16]SFG17373.1 hypothetical protein SAMN05216383_106101 [Prevotella sp. KH2C16]